MAHSPQVRNMLAEKDSNLGCNGAQGVDGYSLAHYLLLPAVTKVQEEYACTECDYVSAWMEYSGTNPAIEFMWSFSLDHRKKHRKGMGLNRKLDVSQWLSVSLEHSCRDKCPSCGGTVLMNFGWPIGGPPFLYLIPRLISVKIETEIKLPESNERYRLCGVIYFDKWHFVARIVDKSGGI